ncbi:MAG TPA: sigma-54-dependent Fis family transcriptional regulator [Sphaerochaeta sp.]|jgi:two-component system response regulator AtoC|nr:sigma-54-dependent Fis family transcriptional regulator [Sphaerochaeta sp.]
MNILIVDDEPNIRDLMHRYLKLDSIDSDCAENGLSAQRMLKQELYDACLIDLKMPGMDGLSLIGWIRSEGFRMPIIMVSAHGEIADAVSALKQGAQDYIVKPFDPEELVIRLKKLVDAQNLRNLVESETRSTSTDDKQIFVGESPSIRKIKDLINRISDTTSTVLITGESGTGKEVVARDIHASSPVKEGPFVAINIGGVPENLLESELFGYEKGAFTGAGSRKTGMFELASGGTLFLDEIGDMPLSLQVKILRVLQERRITRLGGTDPMPINARIIAATNKDVEHMVREGLFREDLFYRLNVVRITIPPLRERREDIPLLAAGILKRFNRQMGNKISGFTCDALSLLCEHTFFGNVRELENILERAVIFSNTSEIHAEDLDLRGSVSMRTHEKEKEEYRPDVSEGKSLKDVEIDAIIRALHRWEGNRTRTAKELGISRRTLINKIAENNLDL